VLLQNQSTDNITYTTIEPRDEGGFVRVMACGKEPEPVDRALINDTDGTPELEYKPDALIWSQVTISGSLIDTWRSLCHNCEYDTGA